MSASEYRPPAKAKVAGAIGASAAIAAAIALALPGLKHDEGKKNDPYLDIVRVPTVCYGHTGGVNMRMRYTDAQCDKLLTGDAETHLLGALRCVPALENRPYQLAAVTRLTFNIGVGGFCRSSIAKRMNAGQWKQGCNNFLAWDRAGGRVVRGLSLRRQRERAMCLTGL